MAEEPRLARELSLALPQLSHPPRGPGRAGSAAILEGSESPASEGQLWPSRKPRLKWKRCVRCGLMGPESLPLTGRKKLGGAARCQGLSRAHHDLGPGGLKRPHSQERWGVARFVHEAHRPAEGILDETQKTARGKCLGNTDYYSRLSKSVLLPSL